MTLSWPKPKTPYFMGVINLTPDSFSDGTKHLDPSVVGQTLTKWSESPQIFPDFGAESTAPMNSGVEFDQEWQRLETFLEFIEVETLHQFGLLSFDTYRPQTMKAILDHPKLREYAGHILWNDVSGHFDDQVYELLSSHDNLSYVYTHNAVHSRELTPRHREFSELFNPDTILESVTREFSVILDELEEKLREKVILDPGFGFAKDPETSRQLLRDLPALIQHFGRDQAWLIGLSRKSVLQKMQGSLDWSELDRLQAREIESLVKKCSGQRFIFRVHRPLPLAQTLL